MTYKDPIPVLVRIAKLEERLKGKPKTRFAFFKDSSKIIAVSAFIVSIVTTIYSWRKDDIQSREAARRQFDTTIQQAIDNAVKLYEFQVKNKDQPNLGAMNGWFNTQSGLLQNKAVQDLAALNDVSMFDYINAGNIVSIGQPARATELFQKAIDIGLQKKKERDQFLYKVIQKIDGKVFGEKLDVSLSAEQREHDLASTYTSLGQVLFARKKSEEARQAYEAAIQLFSDSSLPVEVKHYQLSIVYKFWAEAETNGNFDCNSALAHLKKAEEYFPEEAKIPGNMDWSSIQYELSYATSYCGSDGKLHHPAAPVSNFTQPTMNNAPIPWPNTNDTSARPDGNNTPWNSTSAWPNGNDTQWVQNPQSAPSNVAKSPTKKKR
jgi:tetratricopeptide (TPR) repeat protein